MIEKLRKGIEESKVEKERLMAEKEKLRSTSKETEEKAIVVMENCVKIQEVSSHFSAYICKCTLKWSLKLNGKRLA